MVLPAYPPGTDDGKLSLSASVNEGRHIAYLVSAPTMRIPSNVSKTVNAYLAFRAILRAGTMYIYMLYKCARHTRIHTHTHSTRAQ